MYFCSSTGSTWLLEMISNSPHVCVVGIELIDSLQPANRTEAVEYLISEGLKAKNWTKYTEDLSNWLMKRSTVGKEETKMKIKYFFHQQKYGGCTLDSLHRPLFTHFGIKTRPEELISLLPKVYKILSDYNIKVLATKRSRPRAAIASYRREFDKKGQFTLVTAIKQHDTKKIEEVLQPSNVQLPALKKIFDRTIKNHHILNSLTEGCYDRKINILQVPYENMLNNTISQMKKIYEFLKIPFTEDIIHTHLQKSSSNNICIAVSNCREVCFWMHNNYVRSGKDVYNEINEMCEYTDMMM